MVCSKKIHRGFFVFLLAIILINCNKYTYAINGYTKVAFVGVEHSPLVEGDTETFYLRAEGSDKVRYRVFMKPLVTNKTEELTKGYTQAVKAKDVYKIYSNKKFKRGKYKIIIWVKDEKSNKNYDSQYEVNLNCVSKDNSSRVYLSQDIDTNKEVYTVGEKVLIKGVKNISGMKGPYTYRLHIYDVENDKWIIDDKGYRNSVEWVPSKPGTYVLDLWAMSHNSTLWTALKQNPNKRLFEGWRLKVVTVKAIDATVTVSSVEMGHSPLVAGERQKFYITSKGAKRVQYKLWICKGNRQEIENWEDITNQYSPVVNADEPYEIYPEKKFWVGQYSLWIEVRDEKSNKNPNKNLKEKSDNYLKVDFECVDKNDDYRVYTENDMDIEKDIYRVEEKVTIEGIKNISGMQGPYLYKLQVLNTKTGEVTFDNHEYRKQIEWIPKEPGTYVLELWAMSSNSKLWQKIKEEPDSKTYDGRKLKVVKVVEKDEEINKNKTVKPYTVIKDFTELNAAIEKGYDLVIKDEDVNVAYEKAKEVIKLIINNDMSALQKELAIHEYIIKNTVYDYESYKAGNISGDCANPYGVLINGKAVCQGYSETMQLLLNMVGVECKVVSGVALNGKHSWNIVKIDGQYYHLDVTWDDALPDSGMNVRYNYFNMSDEQMKNAQHTWTNERFPVCVSGKYEYLQSMNGAIIDKNWFYYSNNLDGDTIYKMSMDGEIKAKINYDRSYYIAVDDNWIYYSNWDYGGTLYKIPKQGLISNTRLNNEFSKDIVIKGDWIYYSDESGTSIYKVKKDGTERQLVK